MPCKINNNTPQDLSQLEDLTKKLVPFAQKQIGFNRPPTINFNDDEKNAANPLGRTAQYDPSSMEIIVFVTGRHIKDILRSIAHELVHHGQNCRGDLDGKIQTELGYAQNNEYMRGMEREAYEVGNLCFRDWEDGIKQQLPLYETIYRESLIGGESMTIENWRIQELNDLLMEKFGYKPPSKKKLGEDLDAYMKMVDYQTGEKYLGEDDDETLEEDEDDDEDGESSSGLHKNPQSVNARIKARIIRKRDIIFEQTSFMTSQQSTGSPGFMARQQSTATATSTETLTETSPQWEQLPKKQQRIIFDRVGTIIQLTRAVESTGPIAGRFGMARLMWPAVLPGNIPKVLSFILKLEPKHQERFYKLALKNASSESKTAPDIQWLLELWAGQGKPLAAGARYSAQEDRSKHERECHENFPEMDLEKCVELFSGGLPSEEKYQRLRAGPQRVGAGTVGKVLRVDPKPKETKKSKSVRRTSNPKSSRTRKTRKSRSIPPTITRE